MPALPFLALPTAAQRAWIEARLAASPPADALGFADDGHRLPGREGPLRSAAVLVPLVDRGDAVNVLLTQRSASLSDHPGQISFPGGRVEPGDHDAIDAALRETVEETGLARKHVSVLGQLPHYATVSGYDVTPVVGWVTPPFTIVRDPVEVDDVFEVPLAFLLEPANQLRHYRMIGAVRRDYWALPFGERYIWGATAAMLVMLDRVLRAA
ncbi:MAG: CoA pyrophosphatase [Proteobacteria bacterium]|nr:CoA pyrophosphatase [Pseudomonadota bacterium]